MPDRVFEKGDAGKRCTLLIRRSFHQDERFNNRILQGRRNLTVQKSYKEERKRLNH